MIGSFFSLLALYAIFLSIPAFCLISGMVALGKVWSMHRALDHVKTAPTPGYVVWLGLIPFVGPLLILVCALAVAKGLHQHTHVGKRALRALPLIAVSMVGLFGLECSYGHPFSTFTFIAALMSLGGAIAYWSLLESDLRRLKTGLATA